MDHKLMCPECDYSTVYSGLMDEHISSHYADPDHTEGVVQRSERSFDSEEVAQHKEVAQRNERFSMKEQQFWNYECSPCGIKFVKEDDMVTHFKTIHPDSEIAKSYSKNVFDQYKCDKCDYSCASMRSLSAHKRSHAKKYSCKTCTFSSSKQTYFDMHNCNEVLENGKRHQMKKIELKSTKRYSCDKCSFTTSRSQLIAVHTMHHIRQQRKANNPIEKVKPAHGPVTCGLCDHKYSCRASYNYHLKFRKHQCAIVVRRHKKINCSDCDEDFTNVKDYMSHMRYTHPNAMTLVCDKCNICEIAYNAKEERQAKKDHRGYCRRGKITPYKH